MAPPDAASIVQDIIATSEDYKAKKAGSREALLDLGHALTSTLELPSEFIQRSMWAEPALSAINRMAVDWRMYEHLRDSDGLTLDELALRIGVEADLLARFIRHLVAMKILFFDEGKIFATPLSNGLAGEEYQKSIEFCYECSRPSFNNFPDYFKNNQYKQVADSTNGPYQFSHCRDSPMPFFPWLQANPPNELRFAFFMAAYRAGHKNWWDAGFYPVQERLIDEFQPSVSDVLLVDVGGGRGHDLEQFAATHAKYPGKLVLQDQEAVIATAQPTDKFEAQAHDFFTPQPLTARAYSLHSILHDWTDQDCLRIIENLKPALKPGYSLVLFNEIVVSDERPALAATCMDLQMMAHLASRERTEADWRKLLAKGGLRITNIYRCPGSAECVIEADLQIKEE